MGALGKARVFLWLFTIVIMLAGSLGVIIYNKPLELKGLGPVNPKTIIGKVWFNAVIALHSVYLIGVGFEILSRTYLLMVGSTCSEQRRVFLCCFLYSMTAWWKLMMILGVISVIIIGALTGLLILLEGIGKVDLVRVIVSCAVSLIEIFLSVLSFLSSRKIQRRQDEEEENLHGDKKKIVDQKSSTSSPSSEPPCTIQEKESGKSSDSNSPSAVMPA